MGVYNKFNVKTATTANHKEKELSNKKYGMYSIYITNMVYIGQTKINIEIWLKQYLRNTTAIGKETGNS